MVPVEESGDPERLAECLIVIYGTYVANGDEFIQQGSHPGTKCTAEFTALIQAFAGHATSRERQRCAAIADRHAETGDLVGNERAAASSIADDIRSEDQ